MKTLFLFLGLCVLTADVSAQNVVRVSPDTLHVLAVYAKGDTLWISASSSSVGGSGRVLRSDDGGASWTQLAPVLTGASSMTLFGVDPLRFSTLYAITQGSSSVYKSTDAGQSWQPFFTESGATKLWTSRRNSAEAFVANINSVSGSYEKLHRTTDGGVSWAEVLGLVLARGSECTSCADRTVSVWLGSDSAQTHAVSSVTGHHNSGTFTTYYRSSNAGQNWQQALSESGGRSVSQVDYLQQGSTQKLVINGRLNGVAGVYLADTLSGVWQLSPTGTGTILTAPAYPQNAVIVNGTQSLTLHSTTNGGVTWQALSPAQLPSPLTSRPALDGISGKLYFPTAQGLYLYQSPLASPTEPPATPTGYRLSQNYPNPFNPETVMTYELPVPGDVSLKVFDVLGKEVISLVTARQPAGNYRVRFNASGLPSGAYFYRLQAGGQTLTRRATLLK